MNGTSATKSRSYSDVMNRVIYSVLMMFCFVTSLSIGITVGIIVAFSVLAMMFREVSRIGRNEAKESQLPWTRPWRAYVFTATTVNCVLLSMEVPLTNTFPALHRLYPLLPFIAFCCPVVGFIAFIISLKYGYYRYQITRFIWTVMPLIVMESQFYFELCNMANGMIWFLLPVFCVVVNDSWAYIFGKLFGRTKLLLLSPKKTVEGFVGALIVTVMWSFWFSGFLSHFPEMHCPAVGFGASDNARCIKNKMFDQREVFFPSMIQSLSGNLLTSIHVSDAQIHGLVLGAFASLVAPFGGFFASALKRSFHLKDFGNLIPGHGGMTDRMDCQGVMAVCTYFYLRTFALTHEIGYDDILKQVLTLSANEQRRLCEAVTF